MLGIQEKLGHDTIGFGFMDLIMIKKESMITSLRSMPSIEKKDEIPFKKMGNIYFDMYHLGVMPKIIMMVSL
jgi:hypothetical protein